MSQQASVENRERVIDVREISPSIRHNVLFQQHLDDTSSLQLIVDHDPRRLRLQLEDKHGERVRWTYLEQGPDLWRVRLGFGPPKTVKRSAS